MASILPEIADNQPRCLQRVSFSSGSDEGSSNSQTKLDINPARRIPDGREMKVVETRPTPRERLKGYLNYLNPAYHLRRVKEDLNSFKMAVKQRGQCTSKWDVSRLEELFRGKLFGVFFLSGPSAFLGFTGATIAQYWTQNSWVGLFSTIIFTFLITTLAYQIFWYLDNRKLYERISPNFLIQLRELEIDLWPIHWTGMRFGLVFSLLTVSLSSIVIVVANFIRPGLANALPIPIILMLLEFVLVSGTFMRIMGDQFDRHSRTLAAKYRPSLVSG
jgi:hypothetical protein